MDYKLPSDLKYTSSHEWLKIEKEIAIIGISDYAQHQLGDVVFVEFPEIGEKFQEGDVIGEIESVKAVGEFLIPLTGEIIELNEDLSEKPELVNSSPYEKGWLVKIRFSDDNELNSLLSSKEYKELVERETN